MTDERLPDGTLTIKRSELAGTFDYVEWDEESQNNCDDIKKAVEHLEELILEYLNPSREASLAITNLEQVFMWVGKAIRRDQIGRE